MSMRIPPLLLAALLLLLLGPACGSGNDHARGYGSRDLVFRHADMDQVPAAIATFEVAALRADYSVAFSPVSLDRRQGQEWVFRNLPADAVWLRVENYVGGIAQTTNLVPIRMDADTHETVTLYGNPLAPVSVVGTREGKRLLATWDPHGSAPSRHPALRASPASVKLPVFVKGVGFNYQAPNTDWSSGFKSQGRWFSYIQPDIGLVGANTIRMYGITGRSNDDLAWTIGKMLEAAHAMSSATRKIYVIPEVFGTGMQLASEADAGALVELVQKDPNYDHVLLWNVAFELDPSYFGKGGGLDKVMGAVKAKMTTAAQQRLVMHSTWNFGSSDKERARLFNEMSNLDVLGLDSYYGRFGTTPPPVHGLETEATEVVQAGLTKPFLFAEWLTYDWQLETANSGLNLMLNGGGKYYMFEENSTSRSAQLETNWKSYIQPFEGKGCLGGCVLNWGPPHQSGFVTYWQNPFYAYLGDYKFLDYAGGTTYWTGSEADTNHPGGSFTQMDMAYALARAYGGSLASKHPPAIVLGSDGDPQGIDCTVKAKAPANDGGGVAPGDTVKAAVTATDADGDTLTFTWYLVGGRLASTESDAILKSNPDTQLFGVAATVRLRTDGPVPATQVQDGVAGGTRSTVSFTLPAGTPRANNYQIRVLVTDSKGAGATAAVAFRMK